MSPVLRQTPLPKLPARGQLIVPAAVVNATATALRASRGDDGRHEAIVLWAGRTAADTTLVVAAVVPDSDHGWGHVLMDERQVSAAARAARRYGLGIVAQVHSHPGNDVRHSDGDDHLVLMPFENMFSLVVGNYGDAPVERAGLHQFQDSRWCLVTNPTDALVVVPEACT